MHKNVQIEIAKKVKEEVKYRHEVRHTNFVDYEVKYQRFYIYCVGYFGGKIIENFIEMLDFIVAHPENLDRTIEDCIASYNESLLKKPLKKSKPFVFNVSHVAFFILGMLFMVVIAMICLYAT